MFALSQIIPVLMRSSYQAHGTTPPVQTSWIQWRGRIFRHRTQVG